MKTIQEIKTEFEQILSEVSKINGLTTESMAQIATVILQESGKFQRTEAMNAARLNNYRNSNGNQPATFKQKNGLRKFGIRYSNNITKAEASRLLSEAIAEANGRR